MAQSDWTDVSGSLVVGSVSRGVTSGITPPTGGGNQVFGFRSLDASNGAVAKWANQVNYGPMASGGIITGVLQRSSTGGGDDNFSPFLYLSLQSDSILADAYMIGLSDADPHRIVLRKGDIAAGTPGAAIGSSGILRRSTEVFDADKWLHVRMDIINQAGGDVLIQMFRNQADIGDAAVWQAVLGLEDFTDDSLGVNTGTVPLIGGRAGYGFHTEANDRRAFVDQIDVLRQL